MTETSTTLPPPSARWRTVPGSGRLALVGGLPGGLGAEVGAECTQVRGQPVTLLRHDYGTWRRLREAGLSPPSPLAHYDWPARFKPMAHQRITAAFFVEHERCFCLNDIGTGKTHSAIWAADFLTRQGAVRRVLVIAPLSTCMRTWVPELFQALPSVRASCPRGRQNIERVLADDRETWVVLNPENTALATGYADHFDLIVVDEFTKFKNVATQRWKALDRLARGKRLWLMSGTPIPQSPEDGLGPVRLVTGLRVTKGRWRDMTMYPAGPYKWLPRENARETVFKHMQPAIRFAREDCFDLPERQTIDVQVDLTPGQKKALKSIEALYVAHLESGAAITAANAAAVLTKSLQIMAGGVYGEVDGDRVTHKVDAAPFFDAVEQIVDQSSCPVLVFTSFKSSATAIHKHLEKAGFTCALITGDTRPKARMEAFQTVQDNKVSALIAVPATMEHGITLTASHVVVWATPPFSHESYMQANGRAERKGQTKSVLVHHIVQNLLAKELFKRLNDKKALQDTVLEMLKRGLT